MEVPRVPSHVRSPMLREVLDVAARVRVLVVPLRLQGLLLLDQELHLSSIYWPGRPMRGNGHDYLAFSGKFRNSSSNFTAILDSLIFSKQGHEIQR